MNFYLFQNFYSSFYENNQMKKEGITCFTKGNFQYGKETLLNFLSKGLEQSVLPKYILVIFSPQYTKPKRRNNKDSQV